MTARRMTALAALLLAGGVLLAQEPPARKDPAPKGPPRPAPGSLEDTLDKALRNSADIKAAEARVREAEAELNRVRQQVLTRATALHTDLNVAKRMLAVAEQSLAIQERLTKQGAAGTEGLLGAQALVEKHRGEVEKLETELKSLRGEFAVRNYNATGAAFSPDGHFLFTLGADGSARVWDPATGKPVDPSGGAKAPAVQGSMAERVRKLLDQEVEMPRFTGTPPELIEALWVTAKLDVPYRLRIPVGGEVIEQQATKLPVGAYLQLVEDLNPDVRIVIRDYGLLVTTRDRLPDGAVRAVDLWKAREPKKDEPKPAK